MLPDDGKYEHRQVGGPINMKHHTSPIAQPGKQAACAAAALIKIAQQVSFRDLGMGIASMRPVQASGVLTRCPEWRRRTLTVLAKCQSEWNML